MACSATCVWCRKPTNCHIAALIRGDLGCGPTADGEAMVCSRACEAALKAKLEKGLDWSGVD